MQEGKKNLSNWQQNKFHVKCDAAGSSKGAKGAPEEGGKDKCCSRGPCNKLGELGWREGRARTPLQTLGAAAPLLHSPTRRGQARILQKRNALPFSLLILVMAYPVFGVLREGVHGSAELAAKPAPGALVSRMSCLQGPRLEKFCIITSSNLALKQY